MLQSSTTVGPPMGQRRFCAGRPPMGRQFCAGGPPMAQRRFCAGGPPMAQRWQNLIFFEDGSQAI